MEGIEKSICILFYICVIFVCLFDKTTCECDECTNGQYCDSGGDCYDCQVGAYNNMDLWPDNAAVAYNCSQCAGDLTTRTTKATNVTDCGCAAGREAGPGNTCVDCSPGEYNPSFNEMCRACPENQNTTTSGATKCEELRDDKKNRAWIYILGVGIGCAVIMVIFIVIIRPQMIGLHAQKDLFHKRNVNYMRRGYNMRYNTGYSIRGY